MIIFDLDGTLWDATVATLEAANIMAKNHNLKEFSMETVIKGMGLSKQDNASNYLPDLDLDTAIIYLDEISEICSKIITSANAVLYDGVREVIKNLSEKYKLGIITNNRDTYVETFLKISGLKDYFIDYMGTATYNITKGEAIAQMIKKHNEPHSFYVGDIKRDMIASNEAQVNFIHARYGFEKNIESIYHINDIKELEVLLDKIY